MHNPYEVKFYFSVFLQLALAMKPFRSFVWTPVLYFAFTGFTPEGKNFD
jgi:hypothetical protein